MIRDAEARDSDALAELYNFYVRHTYTTFEEEPVGGAEMGELLGQLHNRGMHTALAGIALPNAASVALHEKLGFEKVAHLNEVGRKFDRWIDVGYWQLVFGQQT